MNIAYFMHIGALNNFRPIIEELLKSSKSLFEQCKDKFFCVNCVEVDISEVKSVIDNCGIKNYTLIDNKSNDWEYPTLERLYDYAKSCIENTKIIYTMTKGVNRVGVNECIEEWRQYMTYFLVERHDLSLKALEEYETIGVDLVTEPEKHYSGNFWGATSDYIKRIKHPREVRFSNLDSYRHRNEFWICSEPGKHGCLHNSGIDVYERHLHRYPKESYVS
jgi:hypothetical protein